MHNKIMHSLSKTQDVTVKGRLFYFCHCTTQGSKIFFPMTRRHLLNLEDILHSNIILTHYPLGDSIWLHWKRKEFVNHRDHSFFRFSPASWNTYIKRVHPRLINDVHRRPRVKHDAGHADPQHRSRGRAPTTRRYPASRPTRNARPTSVQRQKHSAFSQRYTTNPRSTQQQRSRSNAPRYDSPTPSPHQSATDEEYCSECTIEEPATTPLV